MPTIKLTNDVKISSNSLGVGIDTTNILYNNATTSYTAVQDCWVFASPLTGYGYNDNGKTKIDGVDVNDAGNLKDGYLLKSGQKITCGNFNGKKTIVFGTK